jgi:PAS domain S-box-containing protein
MRGRLQLAPNVWWSWACIAILASGAGTLVLSGVAWTPTRGHALGYGLGTLYPALLLGGALAYAGRAVSPWLPVGALLLGLMRGLAQLADQTLLAHGTALLVEPALAAGAAVVIWRSVPRGPVPVAHRVLPPALLAVACLDASTALAMLRGGALPDLLLAAWLVGTPSLLVIQLLAWNERQREEMDDVRRELEREVAEQAERYRVVSELSSDYSFSIRLSPGPSIDTDWVTDAGVRITGYAPGELDSTGWMPLIHPEDRPRVIALNEELASGERDFGAVEARIITKAGEERWLNFRLRTLRGAEAGAVHVVGAARDITERVRAEQEQHRLEMRLRETQRLESLGRLAGGIAHDFNNVLTVILGNTELAAEELESGTLKPARLGRVRAAARYAAGLTEQILTYSGKAAMALEPLDLSVMVAEMLDLLRASVSEKVTVETQLPSDPPAIEGDITQLRQVLVNLVSNASEALGAEGGLVRVRTGTEQLSQGDLAELLGSADARPGAYVFLEVSDTGEGLAPEERDRIFEPFYSTRGSGRGRGLAAVLGIVRAHGGVIRIESKAGRGATFRILLPRSTRRVQPRADSPDAVRVVGRGRVLVVDDDEAVLEVAQEFLRRSGFEVRGARGGQAAVDVLREHPDDFDAVVLDLVMPDLSGEQTFLALRELRPDLPVVLASGYDREQAAARFTARGIADFVRKPYDPEALAESVRVALTR